VEVVGDAKVDDVDSRVLQNVGKTTVDRREPKLGSEPLSALVMRRKYAGESNRHSSDPAPAVDVQTAGEPGTDHGDADLTHWSQEHTGQAGQRYKRRGT
jgi:hypothetical protein